MGTMDKVDFSYKDDLSYLFQELKTHPVFIRKPGTLQDFQRYYESLLQKHRCESYEEFVVCASELMSFFHDGHTNIEIPYTQGDKCLHLPCEWEDCRSDSLFLLEDVYGVSSKSQIVKIENRTISEMIDQMMKVIPHENRYLVKSRMIHYPYINYHMFSEWNLRRIFGPKNAYNVEFCENGKRINKLLSLTEYDGYPCFYDDADPFQYEIKGDSISVHIDSCVCDQRYLDFLQEVAVACEQNHIRHMILDLSKNMGGTTSVIDEFIAYTHAENYTIYSTIDYSGGTEEILAGRHCEVINEKKKILFPQDIQLKVGYDTFSAARTFAVTLIDNGIATLMEGCSGGKPNSYGAPRKGFLPGSKIRYRVSTRYFMRPDVARDEDEWI